MPIAKRRSRSLEAAVLRVLLDEGVPVSVARAFTRSGYEAIFHNQVLSPGASDLRVAASALANKAVLIAIDKDMKRLSGRYGNADPRYARLHLIKIACSEPLAASRIAQAMSLIELEWIIACEKPSRRLYLEVGPHHLRTMR